MGGGFDRRADTLEEAARIAKDFIGDHARAVGYLDQLFRLRPADGAGRLLARAPARTPRTLGRAGRGAAIPPGDDRRRGGARAAASHRDHAAREARPARRRARRGARPSSRSARGRARSARCSSTCSPTSAPRPRRASMRSTRCACATRRSGAGARVPRASDDRDRLRRRATASATCVANVATACTPWATSRGALDQYVALIALAPEDRAVEDGLRQLAEAARDPGAVGLGAGGRRSGACRTPERRAELLVRSARVEDRQLGRTERASELFEEAVGSEAGRPELRLESLRRLEEIYDGLGEQGEAARTPSSGSRPSSPSPAQALHLGAGGGAGAGARRRGPGARRLAGAARAGSGRRRGARRGARAARPRASAGRRSSICCAGGSTARPPAHQVRADLIEMATLARDRLATSGTRDRHLARGRHALRRR